MGAGASASVGDAKGADKATIEEKVKGLSAAEKQILRAALEVKGDDSAESVAKLSANIGNIAANEAAIHELHLAVMTNKQGVYEARSMIEENRANIMKNYSAAFVGNRQMANENTDAIFKNRVAILDALKVDGPVQENFRNSKYNEASIEFLENRSLLNNRVAKVNEMMSAANADLIAINDMVLSSNEEIVTFNTKNIQTNSDLIEKGSSVAQAATPETNEANIAKNKETITKIKERNDKYNADMAERHVKIKSNREAIEKNAAEIKERRKKIVANKDGIKTNGAKIVELLKAGGAGDLKAIADGLKDLSDDERANILAALSTGEDSEVVKANRKKIGENEAKLHQLHLDVLTNKSKLYAVRSIIEENRALVLKNYSAAFIGNRQMANQNTDDIFKNRVALLDALKLEGQVQENFRNIKHNETNVEFLEHRSLLNNRVAKVNEKMAEVNTKMMEVNQAIMVSNEEIVTFNAAQIETNGRLLEGIKDEKSTPEANAARIEENTKRIAKIEERNAKYDSKVETMLVKALENRALIEANAKAIDERRDKVMENRVNLYANGEKVAKMLLEA